MIIRKFMGFFQQNIEKKNINFKYNRLFCCNHTCYFTNMASVTSASRYITSASLNHPPYLSRSSMYIRGLIPRNFAVLAEAVPIEVNDNMDSAKYQSDSYLDIEMTCERVMFPQKGYVFMHDPAPCHNSKSTRTFLECNGIPVLE